MQWDLSSRLGGLPLVLAGPVLRSVTPKSVTVWVALKTAASVKLTIMDQSGAALGHGTLPTIAVGQNLHIAAVTAKPDDKDLTEGVVYQYDLVFTTGSPSSSLSKNLATATNSAAITYGSYRFPTFVLPPKDLNKVRLFFGSCRKPHGDGGDALALLDPLIQQTANNAPNRPHQLLLGGDQIYADDVAELLLLLLTDAGETLLGWNETISGVNKTAKLLPPYFRTKPLQDAGFTSVDTRCHLMSLSEYLAMYLFVWSDVLWPTDSTGKSLTLPTPADLATLVKAAGTTIPVTMDFSNRADQVRSDAKDLTTFYGTVATVRRVLANIPTYMICDDHEITDDWNMTLGFCRNVYSSALGKRVIQNGLTAYALCQHWGNAPDQFDQTNSSLAGSKLLHMLDGVNASSYDANDAQIQSYLGIHDWKVQQNHADFGVFHDSLSLTYNYVINTAGYVVIVTDTRTWRSYPNGNNSSPTLLPLDQLTAQISNAAPSITADQALLVVITTNAPETEALRTLTRHYFIATHGSSIALDDPHPDLWESWEVPSLPFDRLLARLTDKLPLDAKGRHHGSVILLSGDVHYGFASRIKYNAVKRIDDGARPQPAVAVFAQFVSSALKNESGKTREMHREGYRWSAPAMPIAPPSKDGYVEGYVGYDSVSNVKFALNRGNWLDVKNRGSFPLGMAAFGVWGDKTSFDASMMKLSVVPDYRFRLDYETAVLQGVQLQNPPAIPPVVPGATADQRRQAALYYNQATNFYRVSSTNFSKSQNIVGVNNISEVTFHWESDDALKWINHTLRYANPDLPGVDWWATYTFSLDPTEESVPPDKQLWPDIKASKEG
jgi:hypothetical protein